MQIEHLPLFWYLQVTNCTTRFSERAELAKNGKIKIYKCVMYFFPLFFLVLSVGNIVRIPIHIFMLLYWVQCNFKFLFLVVVFYRTFNTIRYRHIRSWYVEILYKMIDHVNLVLYIQSYMRYDTVASLWDYWFLL